MGVGYTLHPYTVELYGAFAGALSWSGNLSPVA